MMTKKVILLYIVFLLVILTGCSTNKDKYNIISLTNEEQTLDEKIKDNTFGIYNLKCSALDDYDIVDINNNILLLSNVF